MHSVYLLIRPQEDAFLRAFKNFVAANNLKEQDRRGFMAIKDDVFGGTQNVEVYFAHFFPGTKNWARYAEVNLHHGKWEDYPAIFLAGDFEHNLEKFLDEEGLSEFSEGNNKGHYTKQEREDNPFRD
jgi:hypothetical protein